MKKNIFKYITLAVCIPLWVTCTPDDYTYYNNENVDPATIDSVSLVANHLLLLADGRAQVDLRPLLYNKQGFQIPDSRIKEEWLDYTSETGVPLTRYFSTADASLIGQSITAKVEIKGTGIVSNSVSFRVVAPLAEKYTSEITVPVVFHLLQTTEDLQSYGGSYSEDKIELHLQKINHLFEGSSSVNPVGTDTHIRFRMAQYDPYGQSMPVPGINRMSIPDITPEMAENNFAGFLKSNHLVWPADKYLNIWLISDRKDLFENFGNSISQHCLPRYLYPGTPAKDRPEGITWEELAEGTIFLPSECGIIYKLQELDLINRKFSDRTGKISATNELAYYIGRYLGLLPTCTFDTKQDGTDFCEDTLDYWGEEYSILGYNHTTYKEASKCYFRAENIMDDPKGLHVSVSKKQCERIRWVLENCPERAAWKSNFAFAGR